MKNLSLIFLLIGNLLISSHSWAQTDSTENDQPQRLVTTKWYDKINLRGYAQLRYNRLLETNPDLGCEQCDKSWGDGNGFFLRRVRLVFFGQVSKKVYVYIQPDFASSNGGSLNFLQLRDAYVDLGVDSDNEFRFRLGQSKIPYGFENMQSSQNRLTLDRADGINSAFVNERDLGIFFYWAPKELRERFSQLVRSGLKGSGDYGVAGIGIFNGQGANKPEANNKQHVVARFSYPLLVGKQFIEPGIQAYTGKYTLIADQLSSGVKVKDDRTYTDQRVAASLIVYPQPFGLQAEYNFGKGPRFNKLTDSIETTSLNGGYVMVNYKTAIDGQLLYPFVKYQYYDGGKKFEKDARSYMVKDLEIGVEWEPTKFLELVACYTISSRRYEDFALQDNLQHGNLLRLQAQVNF